MDELDAAIRMWESIAAFAWKSHELSGPGAVLVTADSLIGAVEGDSLLPVLNYFAIGDIPAGDDFRPLLGQYDPMKQVVLMIGGDDQPERVYIIESDGRPSPPACAAAVDSSDSGPA